MIHSRGLIIEAKSAKSETETKSARLLEVKFSDAKPGEFECYMSIFGNEDEGGDVVAPSAFKATMAAHKAAGTMPKMLLNHGSQGGMFGSDPMADVPIGVWRDISEDSKGLAGSGRIINLNTDRGKVVHGAVKEGAIDGVSIGYIAKEYTLGAKLGEPRRILKAVDLIEASLVTFPMNKMATITQVKARDIDALASLSDFADFLREAGGAAWSKKTANDFVGRLARIARREAGDDQDVQRLLDEMRSARRQIVSSS